MKPKPNIEEFLDGGTADLAVRSFQANLELVDKSPIKNSRVHREQKVFRLPVDLIEALRCEAFERTSKAGGIRVTETELVEQALRAFLKNQL